MRHISSILKFAFIILIFETSCLNEELEREMMLETGYTVNVEISTAILKGEIIDFGKGIEQYGHCWSRSENPTLNDSITIFNNKEEREYESILSNLTGGVIYFYRAYSISGNEVKYGEIKSFKTEPYFLPMVHLEIDDVSYKSVTGKIELLSMGGYEEIDEVGVCLSTIADPLINKSVFYLRNVDSTGYFDFKIDNLFAGKKYYIKSYAVNKMGVKYSFQQTFVTKNMTLAYVSVESVDKIKETSSDIKFSILDFGGDNSLIDYGICWSESRDPTIDNNSISYGSTSEFITKVANLKGLKTLTKYYVKAFAKNNKGIRYSDEVSFITRGVLAYYPFSGDVNDYSGNMNHAINFGATLTSDRFGNPNSAYSFDGLTNYMELSNVINTLQGITVAFWINSKGAQPGENNGIVLSKYNAVKDSRSFNISSFGAYSDNSNNRIQCLFFRYANSTSYHDAICSNWTLSNLPQAYNSAYYYFQNPINLSLFSWKFIVINVKKEALQIWIDGELTVSKIREFLIYANSDEKIFIGNALSMGDGENNHYNGSLDDIRIYNHSLTEEEIQLLYHEGSWGE